MVSAAVHDDIFERARLSRDPRYDGRFFVGVVTTGIYCRPVCPATPPKRENVRFYPSAAAASEAGFRPCLRCRPETAPGTPAWLGTSSTVRRALRMIESGALDDGSLEALAERLGVTSRHLRRLFQQFIGASPLAVAHTQRLHFAKRLLDNTSMSMTDIAVASGFGSVRRFNDAFRKTYQRTPRELRKKRGPRDGALAIRLPFRTPYDFSALLSFFAGRAIPGVESVSGDTYRRVLRLDDDTGIVSVSEDSANALRVTVEGLDTRALMAVVQRVRSVFDVDAPVEDINRWLDQDPRLVTGSAQVVRVPGAWDGFELAVRAVLGQQVSVKAATTMAGRIAERYGEPVSGHETIGLSASFPVAERLVRARFNGMGLVTSRINSIRAIASAVTRGELYLGEDADPTTVREQLMAIRGIGAWTAEYVAMRALKDPDAFPASDLGLLKAMDAHCGRRLKPNELESIADDWRPWRAYAALRLWQQSSAGG